MADLEVWKDYVTVINAARLNAIRDRIITNEGNISYHQTLISANTTDIYNLSNIKLSRDGSQPMMGELKCNSGIKTDTIDTMTEDMLDCKKPLQIDSRLYGNSSEGLWLYSDFDSYAPSIRLYSYNSSFPGKILISTPGDDTPASTRIEIPGKADFVNIKIRESNVLPHEDDYQDLGNNSYRWKTIYGKTGLFSKIKGIENDQLLVDSAIAIQYLWGSAGLLLAGGHITEIHPRINLLDKDSYGGSIDISTPGGGTGIIKRRIWIQGGYDNSWIEIHNANLIPGDDNSISLGQSDKRWKELYVVNAYFDKVNAAQFNVPKTIPFYLENPSSSDKYLLGAGTVSTMYQFNTTVALTGYKLMMLTSASNGYIKVTIDDAKGWNYEKTYSLGSAGGYRYNESFTHIIETDNGIQLKISNCSQISSTSIVLEYK